MIHVFSMDASSSGNNILSVRLIAKANCYPDTSLGSCAYSQPPTVKYEAHGHEWLKVKYFKSLVCHRETRALASTRLAAIHCIKLASLQAAHG